MIIDKLNVLAEPAYRDFVQKLHPGVTDILGVRLPKLRSFAQQLAKEEGMGALKRLAPRSLEERLLYAMVIGYAKVPEDDKWAVLPEFINRINAWSVCDSGVATLKFLAADKQRTFDFLERYVNSKNAYDQRFVAVTLKTFFTKPGLFDEVIDFYVRLTHADYYVRMAVAWGLAEWAVFEPDKTEAVLSRFHPDIQMKAKRKMIESFRVASKIKEKY